MKDAWARKKVAALKCSGRLDLIEQETIAYLKASYHDPAWQAIPSDHAGRFHGGI
jgi:hypothetical protein